MKEEQRKFMRQAIELAYKGMRSKQGGPFGALVVKDGKVIGTGTNQVTSHNDPTAHAEVVAIREACKNLNSFQLHGCEIYTSCEPCPMCLGAIYWARPAKIYFACTKEDASEHGFDDDFIYREIDLPLDDRNIPFEQLMRDKAKGAFEEWDEMEDKVEY